MNLITNWQTPTVKAMAPFSRISPTGTADINIVRHFPVSDRSDQSNDLPHLLSFHGYRNETDATSVPPHIRFPVTSSYPKQGRSW